MGSRVDYSKRVYGLDVYRAVAILIVVYGHTGKVAPMLTNYLPAFSIIDGVELFFVLSGFLIGTILIKIVNTAEGLNYGSLFNFWKRRWFRTLPNYYLILALNYLFVKFEIINGNLDKATYHFLFFLQNFNSGFAGFFWESWSLSIEEWFYIFLPLLLILSLRFLSRRQAIFITVLLLLVLPLVYRLSQSNETLSRFWFDVSFRKVVLLRMDAIGYGVLAAYVKYYHINLWRGMAKYSFTLGMVILIGLQVLNTNPIGFFSQTFGFSIMSFGAMLLLPLADAKQTFKYNWLGKSLTHISLISYSMYLINLGLMAQVIDKQFPPETLTESVMIYGVFWGLLILISSMLYRYFEQPIMKLRDR